MSEAEATVSPSWCSLRASCRFILGGPAARSSQASARLWPQLRVGRIARVAKGGLLRTFVQPDPFFKHRVCVNKKYQSFEKSGKTGTKFPTREIVAFPTSKSVYNQMIFSCIRQSAPDLCASLPSFRLELTLARSTS